MTFIKWWKLRKLKELITKEYKLLEKSGNPPKKKYFETKNYSLLGKIERSLFVMLAISGISIWFHLFGFESWYLVIILAFIVSIPGLFGVTTNLKSVLSENDPSAIDDFLDGLTSGLF